ncbi:MAG TPA: AAA family ATPase [Tepidisphaeraceae bacterium]|nr:AAA family ATPase [Tepidisphaeraceae bacterium]
MTLPDWATELITLYESNALNQFILHGSVSDRMVLPLPDGKHALGNLQQFLLDVLMPRFDVVLSYDLGAGVRVERGGPTFTKWPGFKESEPLPKAPRPAVEFLTRYFNYAANLAKLGRGNLQVGCVINSAHLLAPAVPGSISYDLNALALLMRDWSADEFLDGHALATFLVTENLNDLHPLLVNNARASHLRLPLPTADDLQKAVPLVLGDDASAVAGLDGGVETLAQNLTGASLHSVEDLLKTRQYRKQQITQADLVRLKKQLIERDANGLIEFMESKRTLDDLHGQEKVKQWLRQDFALWRQNDLAAMPMGYLLCGPVGTGKTFMVECLAGEAGVPVVKLKNFRDKWVGSTESNLEKVFRLLHALGRCFVFVDEADQALGKRDVGPNDSGVSGRVYGMIAEEMSNTKNRGKIVWILASSRPDLIEVDLKRPGRIDVKIPLFPATSPEEAFGLIKALCKKRSLTLNDAVYDEVKGKLPTLLTPGAAETLSVKLYRLTKTENKSPEDALKAVLTDYQNPVPPEVMDFQIALAVREASDLDFVPAVFRGAAGAGGIS